MFQRLCDSAAKLGSTGDVAGTRPILKELQAVLQRWDYETSEDQCGNCGTQRWSFLKSEDGRNLKLLRPLASMLVQSHKINVETERKPIDNHIHHECCRKEALNPVIVTKCRRAKKTHKKHPAMKYYHSLTHFWCETTRINLCGVSWCPCNVDQTWRTLQEIT